MIIQAKNVHLWMGITSIHVSPASESCINVDKTRVIRSLSIPVSPISESCIHVHKTCAIRSLSIPLSPVSERCINAG